jgi:hypothetical protein
MPLKYVGDGSYIFHIPARNLTDDEIKEIEGKFGYRDLRKFLIDSGMYAEPEKPKKVASKKKEKEE